MVPTEVPDVDPRAVAWTFALVWPRDLARHAAASARILKVMVWVVTPCITATTADHGPKFTHARP
jgi:hypothetical protein